jgi:histidinol-phosphate aminotransferase
MSVRSHVLDLRPVAHGSVSAEELAPFGLTPADVLDFSVNSNPLGPSAEVLRAIETTNWTRYPGDDERPLREGLARAAGVSVDHVALGNGSAELLWLLALAVLEPGQQVGILSPTFGEYARAARAFGAAVRESSSLEDLSDARLVFVCNPNNPTGALLSKTDIQRCLHEDPRRMLVLDEAYASFAPSRWRSEPLLEDYPNLVLLRSLTKDHALPGLRLGYLLAAPQVARGVEAVRPPWSVNAGALRAGLATLEPAASAHVDRGRLVVATARQMLTDGFSALGFRVLPSQANFVLVEVGNATEFRAALLPHGLVVRDATSFGLPRFIRVACRLPEDCQRLLDSVAGLQALHHGGH